MRTVVLGWECVVAQDLSHSVCTLELLSISTPRIFLGVIPCLVRVFPMLRDSDTPTLKLALSCFLLHTSLPLF